MDVRQSVIGEIAMQRHLTVERVDTGVLVRRLLLFDRVIVKSRGLYEIPFLVRAFGSNGFLELIESGILKLSCEFTALIRDIHRNGVRHVPLNHFSFGIMDVPNRDEIIRRGLVGLQGISGLKNPDRQLIEATSTASLLRPAPGHFERIMGQLEADLRTNSPSLRGAVLQRLSQGHPAFIDRSKITVEVEEPRPRVFHIKNNLAELGLSPEVAHGVLDDAVNAISNLNQRLGDMEAYSAITGFLDEEAPLLFGKLAGILAPMNPNIAEEQFKRVVELCELPDIGAQSRVDVKKLMEARKSAECIEFRRWLATAEELSDTEIRKMTSALRAKVSALASNKVGKVARFVVTTAVGLIPGINALAGIAAGAVDSFLVDKILPRSGVVAFLADTYPSLFTSA